jgi:hypothetical protein
MRWSDRASCQVSKLAPHTFQYFSLPTELYLMLCTRTSRQQWDKLPMPDGVIATVEQMAQAENQPLLGRGAPLFEWSPGVAIEDGIENIHTAQDSDEHIDVIEGDSEGADVIFPPNEPDNDEHMNEDKDDESIIEDEDGVNNENNEGQRKEHNGSSVDEEKNKGQRSEGNGSSVDEESGDDDIVAEFEERPVEMEESSHEEPNDHKFIDDDQWTKGQITHNLRPNRQRN